MCVFPLCYFKQVQYKMFNKVTLSINVNEDVKGPSFQVEN